MLDIMLTPGKVGHAEIQTPDLLYWKQAREPFQYMTAGTVFVGRLRALTLHKYLQIGLNVDNIAP